MFYDRFMTVLRASAIVIYRVFSKCKRINTHSSSQGVSNVLLSLVQHLILGAKERSTQMSTFRKLARIGIMAFLAAVLLFNVVSSVVPSEHPNASAATLQATACRNLGVY